MVSDSQRVDAAFVGRGSVELAAMGRLRGCDDASPSSPFGCAGGGAPSWRSPSLRRAEDSPDRRCVRMLSDVAVPGTTLMRTMAALAAFLLLLAGCVAPKTGELSRPEPRVGEQQGDEPQAEHAPLARTAPAPDAAASPDLPWLMQRPFACDPMPRWCASVREEVRRYRAHRLLDFGTAAERADAAEALRAAAAASGPTIGRVTAVVGSRVAIQFDSAAAARSMSELGSFYDPDGYKGEVAVLERLGRVWLARVVFLRPEESVRVGDFVCPSLSR